MSTKQEAGDQRLVAVLEESQRRGFIGPGDLTPHLEHSEGFVDIVRSAGPSSALLDLGSGGGLPGLVCALRNVSAMTTLLDANERRTAFLHEAIDELDLGDRARVVRDRAEVFGRDPAHRGSYDVVVSRSFGPPAVVAECGAPLLRVGGALIVSEPPDRRERWPEEALETLGLEIDSGTTDPRFVRLVAIALCPERYPRPTGRPAKRPLF